MPAPGNCDRRASRAPYWPPCLLDRRRVCPPQATRCSCANPPIVELGDQEPSLCQITIQPFLFTLSDPIADAGGEVGSKILIRCRSLTPTRFLDDSFQVLFRPGHGPRYPVRPEPVP